MPSSQWIALVDADHHRRQAFDIFALCEARPGERVASVKGLNSIGHGATVVLHRDDDALVLGRRWILRLWPLAGYEGAHGIDALDQTEVAVLLQLHADSEAEVAAAAF